MSAFVRQIAATILASASVQTCVNFRQYNPDHIAKQSIVAASAFLDVAGELELDNEAAEVALGTFCGRMGATIVGGDRSLFMSEAEWACALGATFAKEFEAAFPSGDAPVPVQAAVPKTDDSSSEKLSATVDVPVEQLGLPKTVVDMLVAAGFTTAKGVLEADSTGKVEAINGIGPQLRVKIVTAATKALTPETKAE